MRGHSPVVQMRERVAIPLNVQPNKAHRRMEIMKNQLAPSLDAVAALWPVASIPQRRAAILALQVEPTTAAPARADEILTRREVAERFHRHPSFVDRLRRAGALRPVVFRGRQRGCGFRSSEVEAAIAAAGV